MKTIFNYWQNSKLMHTYTTATVVPMYKEAGLSGEETVMGMAQALAEHLGMEFTWENVS